MLPKKERLTRTEFNRFFAMGRRFSTPVAQIVYVPHERLHVSVVVSKKVEKRAVRRNKIRRQIYAIVRNYRAEEAVCGVFVIITRPGVHGHTYAALKDEITAQIRIILKKQQRS